MSIKTLKLVAARLSVDESYELFGKAEEYDRLLQNKLLAGSNITDMCKVVICWDLAFRFYDKTLDVKLAAKCAGIKPSSYITARNTVANLLEVSNEKLSVSTLCLGLQCTGVQTLAEKILADYQLHSKMDIDLNLPQYTCMAVYQACRVNKVKVSKSKLLEKSRLKSAQWSKLEADWTKFVDEHFAKTSTLKRGRPKKHVAAEEEPESMEIELQDEKQVCAPVEETEPYEDWKRRMLEGAYKELKVPSSRVKENQSPRRSPRKTPQKSTPSKDEGRAKPPGVRILFPL